MIFLLFSFLSRETSLFSMTSSAEDHGGTDITMAAVFQLFFTAAPKRQV